MLASSKKKEKTSVVQGFFFGASARVPPTYSYQRNPRDHLVEVGISHTS